MNQLLGKTIEDGAKAFKLGISPSESGYVLGDPMQEIWMIGYEAERTNAENLKMIVKDHLFVAKGDTKDFLKNIQNKLSSEISY